MNHRTNARLQKTRHALEAVLREDAETEAVKGLKAWAEKHLSALTSFERHLEASGIQAGVSTIPGRGGLYIR